MLFHVRAVCESIVLNFMPTLISCFLDYDFPNN